MTEFSGRADPDRILPLLWRHAAPSRTANPAAGRPARLTVDAVVAAGIAIADAEGLAATSMARVAAALNVGTMTLYTYAPSRAELVDLMVDEVLVRHPLPTPGDPRPAGWRAQVELYDERTRAMYEAHPWLSEVSTIRPPIGPGMLADREYVLSTVAGLGLPPAQVDAAALAIVSLVTSAARNAAEDIHVVRGTGQSTDAWWDRRGRLWEEYFDVERHPTMTRLWNEGAFVHSAADQAARGHAFGLGALLDGIEATALRATR
jgi:AcrR family transcriptional regulator